MSGQPPLSRPAVSADEGRLDRLLSRLAADHARLNPRKRSVRLRGHATSFSIEAPFWLELKRLAAREGLSLAELVARIDEARGALNLSAALRLVVLAALQGGHQEQRSVAHDTNDRSSRSKS